MYIGKTTTFVTFRVRRTCKNKNKTIFSHFLTYNKYRKNYLIKTRAHCFNKQNTD